MEVNILLFDDFDTMDAFGPAEVFGSFKAQTMHQKVLFLFIELSI